MAYEITYPASRYHCGSDYSTLFEDRQVLFGFLRQKVFHCFFPCADRRFFKNSLVFRFACFGKIINRFRTKRAAPAAALSGPSARLRRSRKRKNPSGKTSRHLSRRFRIVFILFFRGFVFQPPGAPARDHCKSMNYFGKLPEQRQNLLSKNPFYDIV